MKTPGELSEPIQVGTAVHILKLERIIAPEQADYNEVKNSLAADVKRRKLNEMQQQILVDLIRRAQEDKRIVYVDETLRKQAQDAQKGQP